jgi:hypothetical protein
LEYGGALLVLVATVQWTRFAGPVSTLHWGALGVAAYTLARSVRYGDAVLLPIATTALVSLATVSRGFTPVDGAGFVIVLAAGALADGSSRRALAVLTVAPLLFAVLLGPSGGLGQYGP